MNIRKASELNSLEELGLSTRTCNKIKKNNVSLTELVRQGRIDAYNLYKLQTQPAQWRLEVAKALDKAGFIRHDIEKEDLLILGNFRKTYFKFLPSHQALIGEIQDLCSKNSVYEGPLLSYDDQVRTILRTIEPCTEREQKVVKLRMGIGCSTPQTLEQVARFFNVTYGRARQIEAGAKRKLAHYGDQILVDELISQIEACDSSEAKKATELRDTLQQIADEDNNCASARATLYLIKQERLSPNDNIEKLRLSTHATSCLKHAQHTTIAQVIELCYADQFNSVYGIGYFAAMEIRNRLIELELVDVKRIYPDSELNQLDLSVRARNCLEKAKLSTIEKITALTRKELEKNSGLGRITANEIETKLAIHGYRLKK